MKGDGDFSDNQLWYNQCSFQKKSGSDFVASVMMFIINYSNFLSKDAGIFERLFSCTINCDKNLDWCSIEPFSSFLDVQCFSVESYHLFFDFFDIFDFWCCFTLRSINSSSSYLKIWSDWSNLNCSLVSSISSEYKVLKWK